MAKKIPAQYRELDDDQKKKVDEINANWQKHPFVKNYHGHWEEYIAWFEGDQYKIYNELTEKLEDVKPMILRETKNVYNRIMPMVRQTWGAIRFPHEFYVIPSTSEAEDIKASHIASQFIESSNENGKFRLKINRSKLWAIICGCCFWKEWWNKNLTGLVKGNGGKNVEEKGDIDFDFVNPFNCRPDPYSLERKDWRWFIEGQKMPRSMVEKEFNLDPGTLPADPSTQTTQELYVFQRKSIGYFSYEQPEGEFCIRKEYWERKNVDYPKGRFMVIVGDWLLYDGPNPAPQAQIPYFLIPGIIPLLGEQSYDSVVRIGQASQRQLNRYASMIDDHIKNWKIKGMIPWGSLRPGDEDSFTRAGIDFVTYNARFGTPYYQSPPALPDFLATWLAFQEREFESETSVREVSYARLPKYSTRASGVLFEGLKQQDEAVLVPAVEEIDAVLEDAMKYRLALIQQHYSQKRLIKTIGRNKRFSVSYFQGADLRDNTDVRVVPGVDIMTSRKRKEEIVQALVEKGFITDPRKALEILGVRTQEDYIEDEFVDENQAYRQLELMKKEKDMYIAPHPDDNHEVMFRIFNNARKAEDFDSLPKDVQEKIQRRIDEEKTYTTPTGPPPTGAGTPPAAEVPEAVPGFPGPATVGTPTSPNPPVTAEEVYRALIQTGGI